MTPGTNLTASLQYVRGEISIADVQAGASDGTGDDNSRFIDVPVLIRDARAHVPCSPFPQSGFELLDHPTRLIPRSDGCPEVFKYNADLADRLRSTFNAKSVVVLKHTWRSSEVSATMPGEVRAPVFVVHNDYTQTSALNAVRDSLPDASTNAAPGEIPPFLLVTVWRSVAGTITHFPLAVCDRRSIASEDFMNVSRQRHGNSHELQLAKSNDRHEWFYFPQMTEQEALVFICHDSKRSSAPTLHSALNQSCRASQGVRRSLESRCALFC